MILLYEIHVENVIGFQKSIVFAVSKVFVWNFSGPCSVRMRENADRKTPNTDTFHAVAFMLIVMSCMVMPISLLLDFSEPTL